MEKNKKIIDGIFDAKIELDLLSQWFEKDLNDEIYENIICTIDHIIDSLYGAKLKAIELDETIENDLEEWND